MNNNLVIGKRVTIGAMFNSVAATFAYFFPEYAPAIVSVAVPITFITQLAVAHYLGVTT